MEIKWKIIGNTVVQVEVLAKNKYNDMIVGYIQGNVCESDDQMLRECTHYIPVTELLQIPNE